MPMRRNFSCNSTVWFAATSVIPNFFAALLNSSAVIKIIPSAYSSDTILFPLLTAKSCFLLISFYPHELPVRIKNHCTIFVCPQSFNPLLLKPLHHRRFRVPKRVVGSHTKYAKLRFDRLQELRRTGGIAAMMADFQHTAGRIYPLCQ